MAKRQGIDLDMSGIKTGSRDEVVDRLSKVLAQHLEQHFPVSQGYKHKQSKIKHADEKPRRVTSVLKVFRGLLWGRFISLSPTKDRQSCQVEVTPSSLLADKSYWVAIPPVLILGWLGYLTGGFPDLLVAILAMLVPWFFIGFLFMFLINFIIFDIVEDKKKQLKETKDLLQEIRDLLEQDLASHTDDFRVESDDSALETLRLVYKLRSG